MSGIVVGKDQLCVFEVLAVNVDDFLLGLVSPLLSVDGGADFCMSFSPHAEMTDGDIGHARIAVVTCGQVLYKVVYSFLVYGIVIFHFLVTFHLVVFCSLIEDPLRSALLGPVFGGGDTECHLLAFFYPALGGRVDDFPVENTFLCLNETPGQTQENHTDAGKLVYGVLWVELRPVIVQHV